MKPKDKKAYQTGIKFLTFSSLITALGFGGFFAYNLYQNRPPEPVTVELVTVKKGTIKNAINESGVIKLGNQQVLKSPDEGAVEEVLVEVGDRVFLDQEVIRLRNRERETAIIQHQLETRKLEIDLANKQENVASAETDIVESKQEIQRLIAQIRNASKQTEIAEKQFEIQRHQLTLENKRAQVIDAQRNLAETKEKLEREEEIFARGFISADQLRDIEQEVRRAESSLRDAEIEVQTTLIQGESLQLQLNTIQQDLQNTIATIQSELRAAESNLRQKEASLRDARLAVTQSNIDLQKHRLVGEKIIKELKDYIVVSPIDGLVLNLKVKAGDGVALAADLLTVGDPNEELVELELSTFNAAKVKPNQSALVTVIGPDSEPFEGRVESISLEASSGDGGGNSRSSGGGVARVPAIVRLENAAGLIPGTRVNVEIILEQREDVPVLEPDLIFREKGKHFVWVEGEEGNAKKLSVNVGLDDATKVEITSGLDVGDRAIRPPLEEELEEGKAIIVREENQK